MKFGSRLCTRTKISNVARVLAVADDCKIFRLRERRKFIEQLVFAEIATVQRIREVAGIVEFSSLDDAHGKVELLAELQGFGEFATWKAGRICDHCERLCAEDVVSDMR